MVGSEASVILPCMKACRTARKDGGWLRRCVYLAIHSSAAISSGQGGSVRSLLNICPHRNCNFLLASYYC